MLLLIVLLGWIGAVITGGIWYAKRQDQKVRDHNRKTYRLHFPADLSPEQVTVWLRSISGTLRGGKFNLTGKPTLAFETFATSEGITHRLKVPFGAEPFVIPQLRLAGINAVQEEEFEDRNWLKGVEVGITQSGRQLRIYDPADISTSLLATMQSFSPDEALIVQLVITPATPTEQPIHDRAASLDYLNAAKGYKATRDEVNDRRAKLEEPNFMAVLRVAGAAKSDASAQHLVERIRMALTAVRGPKIRFEKRMVTIGKLRDRIRQASGSVIFPMQLSAPELSALIAWPMGRPIIAGLAPSMARHFPPSAMIPQTGRVIGRATQPGAERPVAVSYANALRHTYSIGGTGCLHPDTPIYDPVADTTSSVRRRHLLGQPFHVFAKQGDALVVARANPPVAYRRVGMYRVYNDEHQFVVTGQHRVWNGQTYVEVERLHSEQESSGIQLPTIADAALSRLHEDALHCSGRGGGSLGGHRPSLHSHGQLLPLSGDSDPFSAPSSTYDAEPCSDDCDTDALVHIQAHNRHDPLANRHAKSNSVHPCVHGRASVAHVQPCIASRLCQSRDTFLGSQLCSCPTDTSQRFDQSPQVSSSFPYIAPFSQHFKLTPFRVEPTSDETYYDFHVPGLENYLAAGVIHHNSGKSVTLANLMAQDMEHGHGVILIDAKSDQDALFHRALRVIPSHRLDDVIILDVEDTEMPVGFNILDQGTNELSISQISRLIADMYANASQSIQAPRIFHHCLTALAEAGGHTLIDMPAVLSNFPEGSAEREWQDALGRSVKNRETQLFLQQFMNMSRSARDDMARPVFNRIWEFTDPPAIRRILGQRTSSFSMADVIAQNKILLVYINAAKIGQASSSLLGTLLVNSIWDSVQIGRSARPNFLYLDEFADFIDLPVGVEAMLTKARGSNLGLVMAHQHMAQLRTEVRAAVLNNSATKIFFKAGADDARVLAKEVPGGFVSHEDLQLLARYNTLCTIATDSGTSPPVTVQMYPEPRNTGNENRARQLSRQRYGRPRHEVEQSYSARPIPVDVRPSQRRAPRVSGEGWL